jgi:transposase, IS30 family
MSYTHLSRDDRIRLGVLLQAGLSFRTCARHIGVSPPTISVEIDQNGGRNHYNPFRANREAKAKRHHANQCHRKWNIENRETKMAVELLELGWSPDQIAGRSRLESKIQLFSPATIYNNVNPDKTLCRLLPRKHNQYRRRKDGNERKRVREEQSPMRSIDMRPKHIEKRKRIGHWEGDTIVGKERTARILTHVERKTGYLLARLLYDITAEKIRIESVEAFRGIPVNKKETITYDRGLEFADHELTEKEAAMQIYFAHPYHSWERGTNENTNGLIRRYFPKGTYFCNIKTEQLNEVVEKINCRPRKRLGYRMPYEKFWGVTVRIRM